VGEDDEEAASSIGLSAEEGLLAETGSAGILARVVAPDIAAVPQNNSHLVEKEQISGTMFF
jgi:hypothetical protein